MNATRTPAPTYPSGQRPCPRCGHVFHIRRYLMCQDCRDVDPGWGK